MRSANNSSYLPFRYREINDKTLVTNEVGLHKVYELGVIERFFNGELSEQEQMDFKSQSIIVDDDESWRVLSLLRNYRNQVSSQSKKFNYLILVPTLRCDLSCSYCQVSRAPLGAEGFDWGARELELYESFISSHGTDGMKIEFQGGEPSLRVDLMEKIAEITDKYYQDVSYVICSNLTRITDEFENFIARDNVVVSTSIDGPEDDMSVNRTKDDSLSKQILDNVNKIIELFGYDKLAALPTITKNQINQPEKIIDYYRQLGFNTIFLRPVNYQGFARKTNLEIAQQFDEWVDFFERAMSHIFEINQVEYFEEFHTGNLVRKIFANRESGFVDHKSPARYPSGYCVIDFDGRLYPTDEARMLSRIKHVDLCIGDLEKGWNENKINELNFNAIHHTNQDCLHCAYMPYCGIDLVDDLSRYRRTDAIKLETWFCKRQTFLFDFIFEKVVKKDVEWLKIFNNWTHKSVVTADAVEMFL